MKKLSHLLLVALIIGCGGGGGGGGETSGSVSTPIVTSLAATSITPSTAILNGTVIPNGLQTQSWFEYGTDPALATYTSSPKQDAGGGLNSQAANMTWNDLVAGTTYYFRFCAENNKGYSKGIIVSFTTSSPGSPPTVATLSATSVGATGATLNGNVTPNGLATTAWFEWGSDSSLTIYSNTTTQSAGAGTTSLLASISLSGLSTGSTYYFRVAASNSSGTTKGSILSFVPGAAPSVSTLAGTSLSATGVTLNGIVTANGLATDAWFEWGTDINFSPSNNTPSQSVGSGTTSQPVNAALSGLSTGTLYYYRIVASNGSGMTKGDRRDFVPGGSPAVTTLPATSVGATTATLNGNVTANGWPTIAWFEYGTNPTLASYTSTPNYPVGSGTVSVSVYALLTGQSTGTTYYYRVVASNGTWTTKGSILYFIPGAVPAVTTLVATSVGASTATLNGNVTANGLATNAWFEWSTDPTLASPTSTSLQSIGSGTTSQPVNAALTDLSTGTTYYYRCAASNSEGTNKGSIVSFIAVVLPVVETLEATNVTATSATLRGTVNPNGRATDAWFMWSLDSNVSAPVNTHRQSIGSGTIPIEVITTITFSGDNAAYFRIAAQASAGGSIQLGEILSFTPPSPPPEQETVGCITNIHVLLNTCPSNDPAYQMIRDNFEIRRNGVVVDNIPCSEPVSAMSVAQYSDELILLQVLRVIYYMDRGRSNHLPWTPTTLYEWIRSQIGGINISDTASLSHCCETYDGKFFVVLKAQDDVNRDFDRNWQGLSGNIGLLAHETRHRSWCCHVGCCPVGGAGCDQTYDVSNLSPYAIQWWLEANWLIGSLPVGFSCEEPAVVRAIAYWHRESANGLRNRFCDDQPPILQIPELPGGECDTSRSDFNVNGISDECETGDIHAMLTGLTVTDTLPVSDSDIVSDKATAACIDGPTANVTGIQTLFTSGRLMKGLGLPTGTAFLEYLGCPPHPYRERIDCR